MLSGTTLRSMIGSNVAGPALGITCVENVLEKPLAFKAKLAIGEDAYKSLKYNKNLQRTWHALTAGATGAVIAKTPVVAGVIGLRVSFLSFLGIDSITVPSLFIALAAAGSATAYIGVMYLIRNFSKERVDVIPKFINSPLDILAVSLFDFLAPLALKVAAADREKSSPEHDLIVEYFSNDWGYSKDYAEESLKLIEEQIQDVEIKQFLESISDFIRENPDCNQIEIAKDILGILREIAEVDGKLTEDEAHILDISEDHFKDANNFVKKVSMAISSLAKRTKSRTQHN